MSNFRSTVQLLLGLVLAACSAQGRSNTVMSRSPSSAVEEAGGYRYAPPPQLEDGWRTAAAEEVGLTHAPLERMTEAIRRGDDYPNVHALLIAKDGRLIYEEYFAGEDCRYGVAEESGPVDGSARPCGTDPERKPTQLVFGRDTLHDLRSVTKSVTSALFGIARASGTVGPLDRPLFELFPDHAALGTSGKREVTIEHALTMTAGLAWNESDLPYTDPLNDEIQLYYETQDPIAWVLGKPLIAEPGTAWLYNSGLPVLLGFAVGRAEGGSLRDYARRVLFEPLAIENWEWRGPPSFQGASTPAGNLWLRPRDLAKFGSLYLNGGRWENRQVVPAGWVEASLARHIPKPISTEYANGTYVEGGYGYLWHHARVHLPGRELVVHFASGNGGQRVYAIPQMGLLAVHVTGRYDQPGAHQAADRLFLQEIVPWALGLPAPDRTGPARPVLFVAADEWPSVELSLQERGFYVGAFEQAGERVEVWEEGGILKITPSPGDEKREIHLVPEGNHVFAQGLYEDGRLVKIYWPEARIHFVVRGGRVDRYEVRSVAGHVYGTGERSRR